MNARTLMLPTVLGLALMACGGGRETLAPDTLPVRSDSGGSVASPNVDVTPRVATLSRGTRLGLFLALKGFSNNVSDRSAIWTSSNSNVVQVSPVTVNASSSSIPSAVASAAGVGSATITVWVAGQSASVMVTVTEAATDNP